MIHVDDLWEHEFETEVEHLADEDALRAPVELDGIDNFGRDNYMEGE